MATGIMTVATILECFDALSRCMKYADLQIKFRLLFEQVSGINRISIRSSIQKVAFIQINLFLLVIIVILLVPRYFEFV